MPLFTLTGIEGHIFGPMAKTYGYAIAGGLIATFTISPALSALLLPNSVQESETLIVRTLRRVYEPLIEFALRNRFVTLGGTLALLLVALVAMRTLGLEFLPKLEEGNFWIRATMPTSISLEEGNGYVNRMRRIIATYPEVETVVSQHGRPDDGTDATGFFNAEFFVPLKPADTWPRGVDKDKLTGQMNSALAAEFPGVDFNFSQYIEDNVEEAASGVKGENSVKLFGNDLETLEHTADKIAMCWPTVPGITDLAVLSSLGQPTIRIDVDRARAARYGLAPGRHQRDVQAAIGGQSAGDLYEEGSDRHFPIIVRLRAAIPRQPGCHPPHHHRGAGPGSGYGRAGAAGRCRRRAAGLGRLLHLSRAAAALRSDQVQRARPRSRQRGAGSAAQGRRAGRHARRLSARMGGRIRQSAGRPAAARDRRADQPRC